MKPSWYSRGLAVLAAGSVLFTCNIIITRAAEPKPPAEAKAESSARRPSPYRGKIASVDLDAKTVTLEGKTRQRVLVVSPQTRIHRDGQIIALSEAKAGEDIAGQYRRMEDGKMEAVSMRIGPKPAASEPAPRKRKAKAEKQP
ncbi:MAG: hypothetical protein FJ404_03480 [Verrucomicrobia bacterium]|nr:hypothetical protein [Verrucomicrobiota bacterium]